MTERKMTPRERRGLVLYVLGREWVMVTLGVLAAGICLSLVWGAQVGRAAGVALAVLLLLAVGLYLWLKSRRDLQVGALAEGEIEIAAKAVERYAAATLYFLSDSAGDRYEASAQIYERAQEGETYRLAHTLGTHIVLSMSRVRKL